jgi:uncharacterized membrane protein YuzA (DUF378 family)
MQRRPLTQTVGLLFGATYVLVGLVGFAVTAGTGFAASHGDKLLGIFELNPLHNVVHIAIGAALLWAARESVVASRAVNVTVGATYLLVGIAGLFVLGESANILALNAADNALHFASSVVLLGAGLASVPGHTTAEAREPAGVAR